MLRLLAAGLLVFPSVCTTAKAGRTDSARAGVVEVWSSSADGQRKLERMPDLLLTGGAAGGDAITVNPAQTYQLMVGFGAAMTDASAELVIGLRDTRQRSALLDELFRPDRLNLSFMRLPIGASDFSREHYSFDDMPPGTSDPAMKHFSLARAGPQLAATRAALQRNPGLVLMASPWSAPGWIKTSDKLIGGSLSPGHFTDFAIYLDRYLAETRRSGIAIRYLSIQNEPHFEPGDYPGMRVEPTDRATFIGKYLGPLLQKNHRRVRILEWDHNWGQPDEARRVLADASASRFVSGVAWHCYDGDVAAQGAIHKEFPDKGSFMTECSGGGWAPEWGGTLGWMSDKLIIGAARNWSSGTLLWNLALDEGSGPHRGGCGNCRGVVTIDSRTGSITRNVEYYVLGHASRFVRSGARRIASDEHGAIHNVAFANPDGSRVLIAHNSASAPMPLVVRQGRRSFSVEMPAGEVSTFIWSRSVGRGQRR